MQSCIMVLPVSSWSTEVLVADFGNLTLTNKFRVAGSEDTISIIKKNHNGVFMTSADSFDGVVNQEAKSISNKKSVKSNKG